VVILYNQTDRQKVVACKTIDRPAPKLICVHSNKQTGGHRTSYSERRAHRQKTYTDRHVHRGRHAWMHFRADNIFVAVYFEWSCNGRLL